MHGSITNAAKLRERIRRQAGFTDWSMLPPSLQALYRSMNMVEDKFRAKELNNGVARLVKQAETKQARQCNG